MSLSPKLSYPVNLYALPLHRLGGLIGEIHDVGKRPCPPCRDETVKDGDEGYQRDDVGEELRGVSLAYQLTNLAN